MGDLVGQAVCGTLYYLPYSEFERVCKSEIPKEERASLFADMCRLNTLYMIARAGSGHIGSSFSSLDIVSWLLLEELNEEDVYFSSKGHDAPGYYAALIGLGRLEFDLLHKLRKIDGLPGHPDIGTPGIVTNTGSLGMGISKAKGMVLANRMLKKKGRVFVMTGDGELQEGQFWESLISAVNMKLGEVVAIVDHNKLQSDTFVKNVSDLGDLEAKLRAFGWRVERCDGNDICSFARILKLVADDPRPKIVIADTVKGRGVSFMEHTSLDSDVTMYRFHSGAPDADSYRLAAQELICCLKEAAIKLGLQELCFENIERDATSSPSTKTQRLVAAYSQALITQAQKHPNLVALDADLILDTGLVLFKDQYPDRFIECGIAEQDMVSVAGGLALKGMLPIVHSFACFLSSRPNEQIYNNATEKTKVIYVGSLAGALPGGPGHSHQAVRDIALMSAMPHMIVLEPCCEDEVKNLLEWCIDEAQCPCYLRLVSIPVEIPFTLPIARQVKFGTGYEILPGDDLCIISSGPITLTNAFWAVQTLNKSKKIKIKLVDLPWINKIDEKWLSKILSNVKKLVILENHCSSGGQSALLQRTILGLQLDLQVLSISATNPPPSGSNEEVLDSIGLSKDMIIANLEKFLSA
jgi:transketolase